MTSRTKITNPPSSSTMMTGWCCQISDANLSKSEFIPPQVTSNHSIIKTVKTGGSLYCGEAKYFLSCFRRERFDWFGRQQRAGFEQATKVFFARVAVFAAAGLEMLHHFVPDFEAFELDDADKFVTVFPDLPLLKLERHGGFWGEACLS